MYIIIVICYKDRPAAAYDSLAAGSKVGSWLIDSRSDIAISNSSR